VGGFAPALLAQDSTGRARDRRKSVELDQSNWQRMKDYTWIARQTDRLLDSNGQVKSQKTDEWETVVVYGEPHHRMLERNGKPLSAEDQRKEQEKLDQAVAKREHETPRSERAGKPISRKSAKRIASFCASPRPVRFQAAGRGKDRRARRLGDLGHAQAGRAAQAWRRQAAAQGPSQGVDRQDRVSMGAAGSGDHGDHFVWAVYRAAEPGAKLEFEQTRVNDEVWLPKREVVRGAARLGLVKKLAGEEETTWNNYRKFQVDSKVVATQ
jgi:hypothetical protein